MTLTLFNTVIPVTLISLVSTLILKIYNGKMTLTLYKRIITFSTMKKKPH